MTQKRESNKLNQRTNQYRTKIQKIDLEKPLNAQLKVAVNLLKNDEVIAFPTETVYGLGANALSEKAVAKIFQAKGRPADNPLIIHVAHQKMVEDCLILHKLPKIAEKLIECFWPGPLTLVLPKSTLIPAITTGGLDTVAIRMPKHPIALALIKLSGYPIAAPSANLSGLPSPTNFEDVVEDLMGRVPLIIDGGKTNLGLESTVLDLTIYPPHILRPGNITQINIRSCINSPIEIYSKKLNKNGHQLQEEKPRSPGIKYRHYAPIAMVYILEDKFALVKAVKECDKLGLAGGYIVSSESKNFLIKEKSIIPLTMIIKAFTSKVDLGINLFRELRAMDRAGLNIIFIEKVSESGVGLAIMDRVEKAANSKIFKASSSLSLVDI